MTNEQINPKAIPIFCVGTQWIDSAMEGENELINQLGERIQTEDHKIEDQAILKLRKYKEKRDCLEKFIVLINNNRLHDKLSLLK
mmetsp:Transcript_3445/g.2909  ORF Transcript_3445/g.2909 Transcript_3445/m.2909 type:complete len:85 (-) Transcript_3445:186-440(-)